MSDISDILNKPEIQKVTDLFGHRRQYSCDHWRLKVLDSSNGFSNSSKLVAPLNNTASTSGSLDSSTNGQLLSMTRHSEFLDSREFGLYALLNPKYRKGVRNIDGSGANGDLTPTMVNMKGEIFIVSILENVIRDDLMSIVS